MCKELGRFNITLVKEKDNTHYPFPFFRSLILENNYLKTIEKIVLEPQLDKFTRIYVENEPVFNMWKGFKLVDYDKDYSDKRNIDDVLEIFDNPDNVQIPNLMMILNHIRYIFCSDKKEQYTELFQHMASLLQQPHKILPVCIFKSKPGTVKNLMFETLLGRTILGDDYFTISEKLDLFLGRFNSALEGKLFAILDETATFIGNHEVNNLLKSFATQLFINIERKGMEPYTIPSYLNKMLFTNNEAPIK
jgi:hypothetical protein